MSSTFVRRLTFKSTNLGVDADLILTFDSGSAPGIYRNYYPTAWKVSTFGQTGEYRLLATYNSQFAFTKPRGSVISAFQPIDDRQKTTLIKDSGVYNFTQPVPAIETACENGVPAREDIGFGFIKNPGDWPDTVQVWADVPYRASVIPEFNPILRAYVATGYKEGDKLNGPIQTPVLFEQDLAGLDEDTTWILGYDYSTGVFSIRQE